MVLLHGIEEKTQGPENTDNVAIEVFKKAEVEVAKSAINRSYWLGKRSANRTRPIIVSFCSYREKKLVYDSKKNLKGSKLLITESLTKTRYALLQQCWETYGKRNCWTYDGRIWVSVGEERFVINNDLDLAERRPEHDN